MSVGRVQGPAVEEGPQAIWSHLELVPHSAALPFLAGAPGPCALPAGPDR